VNTLAGILLGLIIVANVAAYARGGPAEVAHWWRLKLIGS
jgi:hypothetical protein